MVVGNSRRIPHFLSSGSPQGLQRAMLLNNLKAGVEYSYFDIQKDGARWIAWFYKVAAIKLDAPLAEKVGPNG